MPKASALLPPRTVFFDGVCNFCDHSVRWLLAHDAEERLHFAPLQGSTAAALQREISAFPREIDTIVYVDATGTTPRVSSRSQAIFEILAELDPSARRWRVLRVLPRWFTDLGYRALASSRYRVFGRRDSCMVPSPEVRARFLP